MKEDKQTGGLSLKAKLLSMLAKREYSRAEIEQKIWAWLKRQKYLEALKNETEYFAEELEPDVMAELGGILDEFEKRGWLSDERYIESLLNQKSHRLGVNRLKQELKTKGVTEDLMQEALENLSATEFSRGYEVWERKFKVLPTDAKSYQKQMRFLLYRGFSTEVAKKILSKTEMNHDN